jgi:hypothetical protein
MSALALRPASGSVREGLLDSSVHSAGGSRFTAPSCAGDRWETRGGGVACGSTSGYTAISVVAQPRKSCATRQSSDECHARTAMRSAAGTRSSRPRRRPPDQPAQPEAQVQRRWPREQQRRPRREVEGVDRTAPRKPRSLIFRHKHALQKCFVMRALELAYDVSSLPDGAAWIPDLRPLDSATTCACETLRERARADPVDCATLAAPPRPKAARPGSSSPRPVTLAAKRAARRRSPGAVMPGWLAGDAPRAPLVPPRPRLLRTRAGSGTRRHA